MSCGKNAFSTLKKFTTLTPFFKGVSVVDFYKFIEERAENQLLTVNSVNPSCSSALFIINVDRHFFAVFKQY